MYPKIAPIVTIENNAVVADSRDVAAYFGTLYKDVLKAIDALIVEAPAIERNFAPIEVNVKVGFGLRVVVSFHASARETTPNSVWLLGRQHERLEASSNTVRR